MLAGDQVGTGLIRRPDIARSLLHSQLVKQVYNVCVVMGLLWCGPSNINTEYAIQANCPYLKKDINHLEGIQRAATRWVKGLRGLTYEERLKTLKLQPLEKRRLRNDLVLTHKIPYNQIDLEATQLFKFSRRPGLRRSSIRRLHQTRRTHRRRKFCACRVVIDWSRLPLTVLSITEQCEFKKITDSYIYS